MKNRFIQIVAALILSLIILVCVAMIDSQIFSTYHCYCPPGVICSCLQPPPAIFKGISQWYNHSSTRSLQLMLLSPVIIGLAFFGLAQMFKQKNYQEILMIAGLFLWLGSAALFAIGFPWSYFFMIPTV